MAGIAEVYVTVLPELSKMAPRIKEVFRSLDNDAREAGRRWGREIEQGVGDVKVKLDADTDRAKAEIGEVARDRHSTVHVDVDKDRLAQAGTSIVSTLVPQFANAGQQAGDTFMATLQGTLKTPAIGIAVAGVLADAFIELGGVAASASQSLLLLPAAGGAVAAAMGTMKLATMGFSDALDAINDPEKFATALQALSPMAQQAALAIQALIPAFQGLKNATQDALFTGVGGMLNGLANQYLPTIQQATTGIATAFNTMFTGVANQLMTPETQASIQGFLANVTQAFQNLAPAAAPFTKAIADLMAAGSGVLPQIATAATQAAYAFSDFITKASQSGDLQRWLGDGLNTIKQLGQIAWDLGRAFLSMAPAGQQILPTIVNFVNGLANVMPKIVQGVQWTNDAFSKMAPFLVPVIGAIGVLKDGLGSISSIAGKVGQALTSAFDTVAQVIDRALQPIREAIKIADMLPGVNIPQIPAVSGQGGRQLVNPTTTSTLAPGTYRRRDGSTGSIPTPLPSLPTAALPPIPDGGYAVPLPPPPKTKGGSSTPNLPYTGTADPNAGVAGSGILATPDNVNNAIAFAAAQSGKPYSYGGTGGPNGDGLFDCSGFMSAIYQQLTGSPLPAGTRMFTTESDFSKLGFAPGYDPSSVFNIGVHNGGGGMSSHMAGTLNGVNVESGANGTLYGGKAKGALDPQFENKYHLVGSPVSTMYGGMGTDPSGGLTSSDLSLRNAQQRVNDTQHSQEQAEGRLNELRAKGTATDRQMEAAEYAVAKAKREHQDAIDGLTVAQDKYNKSAQAGGKGGSSDFQSLGNDLFGGILQAIGFDGSLFKNPFEGGLWKGITGAANFAGGLAQAKYGQADGAGSMIPGGGGDLFSGLLGMAQGFMPGMPVNPNSPNIVDAAQFKPPGAAGPGNTTTVDNGIHLEGSTFASNADLLERMNHLDQSRTRQTAAMWNLPR